MIKLFLKFKLLLLIVVIVANVSANDTLYNKYCRYIINASYKKNYYLFKNLAISNYYTINEINQLKNRYQIAIRPYGNYTLDSSVTGNFSVEAQFNNWYINSVYNNANRSEENVTLGIAGTILSPIRKKIEILEKIKNLHIEKQRLEIEQTLNNELKNITKEILLIETNNKKIGYFNKMGVLVDSLDHNISQFFKAGLLSKQEASQLSILGKSIALQKELLKSTNRTIVVKVTREFNLSCDSLMLYLPSVSAFIKEVNNLTLNDSEYLRKSYYSRRIDSINSIINEEEIKKLQISESSVTVGPTFKKYTHNENFEVGVGVNFIIANRKDNNFQKIENFTYTTESDNLVQLKKDLKKTIDDKKQYIDTLYRCIDEVFLQLNLGQMQPLYLLNDYLNKILNQELEICDIKRLYNLVIIDSFNISNSSVYKEIIKKDILHD